MGSDIIIRVEGLYKKFCISQRKTIVYGGLDVFRSMVGFPGRRDRLRAKEVWALEDIDFEVRRGQTLGIVGVNGAGKTTLLRVLSGIYPPDGGKAYVRGPVGALIAAGAGFHPDMTGRENIYLNGAIVGLKKKEIDAKLEEIVEFAELGQFIDTPVRFYSSGMYVRLGFAIAANIRPRVLVIDEVLSVGDLSFQNKCFRKMKELRESVDAVLFVSHNLDHIRNICSELMVLDSGRVMHHGDVEEGLIRYQGHVDDLKKRSADAELKKMSAESSSFDSPDAEVEKIEIGSHVEKLDSSLSAGDDLVIRVGFRCRRQISNPQFSLSVLDDKNNVVVWQVSEDNKCRFDSMLPGTYQLTVVFKRVPIVAGVYRIGFAIRDSETCELLSRHNKGFPFVVRGNKFSRGIVNCDSQWGLRRKELGGRTD